MRYRLTNVSMTVNTTQRNTGQLHRVSRESGRFHVSRARGFSCWIVKWRIVVTTTPRLFDLDYEAVYIIKLNMHFIMRLMHRPATD